MKPNPPKMIFKSPSIRPFFIPFESEHFYNRPAYFVESFKTYSTLLHIPSSNDSILSSRKPLNVPLLLNSATISPDN